MGCAVPAHGLFDVGERRGAQAELGFRAGRVDDERLVELGLPRELTTIQIAAGRTD
jgi:hypothetical protein